PYDPAWPAAFSAERDRLAALLGDLAIRIDHHGSTAVPGLAAKPLIDIQISVAHLGRLQEYPARLPPLAFRPVPPPDDGFRPFFHRPAAWPHTHHVHLVRSGSAEERQTLAFRDYLREHPEVTRAYESLKRELAPRHSAATFDSRQAYADAKTEFVTRITERALAEGLPR